MPFNYLKNSCQHLKVYVFTCFRPYYRTLHTLFCSNQNLSLHKQRTIETITSIVLLFYLYYIAIRGTLNSSRRKSKLFANKIKILREQLYNFSFIPSKQYAVDRGLDGFSEVFLQYDLNVASEKYLLLLVYYLRA